MDNFSFTLDENLRPRSLEGLLGDIRMSLKVEPTVEVVMAPENSTAAYYRKVTIPGAHSFKVLQLLMLLLSFWMASEHVVEFNFSTEKK